MNWDAIGAIGQMLGSIAVFVTLGYLAIQVRHARSEARRAVSQGRGEALRELLGWYGSERLAGIRVKVQRTLNEEPTGYIASLMEQAELTWEEAVEMTMLQAAYWEFRTQIISSAQELSESKSRCFDWPR